MYNYEKGDHLLLFFLLFLLEVNSCIQGDHSIWSCKISSIVGQIPTGHLTTIHV